MDSQAERLAKGQEVIQEAYADQREPDNPMEGERPTWDSNPPSPAAEPEQEEVAEVDPWGAIQEKYTPDQVQEMEGHRERADSVQQEKDGFVETVRNLVATQGPEGASKFFANYFGVQEAPTPQAPPAQQPEYDEYGEPQQQQQPDNAYQRLEQKFDQFMQNQNAQMAQMAGFHVDREVEARMSGPEWERVKRVPWLADRIKESVRQKAFDPTGGTTLMNMGSKISGWMNDETKQIQQLTQALMPDELQRLAKKKKATTTGVPPSSGARGIVRATPKPQDSKPNTATREGRQQAMAMGEAMIKEMLGQE